MEENILAEVLRERCRGTVDTCEGHHEDNLVDCSKCHKFFEGLEEREKQRQIEKNTRIGKILLNSDDELHLFGGYGGLSCTIVLGKTIKDAPRQDIFLAKQKMELDIEYVKDLKALLNLL